MYIPIYTGNDNRECVRQRVLYLHTTVSTGVIFHTLEKQHQGETKVLFALDFPCYHVYYNILYIFNYIYNIYYSCCF